MGLQSEKAVLEAKIAEAQAQLKIVEVKIKAKEAKKPKANKEGDK